MNIVVTGGASGVGEALVGRLGAHRIWILDVQQPAELAAHAVFVPTDMADPASIDAAVAQLPEQIDGLANVAGIARAEQPMQVLAVNFLGLRHLTETLLPRLAGGRVVNVSSVAGRDWQKRYDRLVPLLQTADFAAGEQWCEGNNAVLARDPYTFSKRMVTAYTMRRALDMLAANVRMNCVSPGPIHTPLYPQFESLMGKAQSDWMIEQTGRAAQAGDIAEVLDMLLTAACGWLNGVDIPVDGGYSAGIDCGAIDFSASPIMAARQ
jgi:NAD(P)-dependent dehydrogenase (short-subunit alcohol dehydrogenase family)